MKKSRKYEARMTKRRENNLVAEEEAKRAANIEAKARITAMIRRDVIGLIRERYGSELPFHSYHTDLCFYRMDLEFLRGLENPEYTIQCAYPWEVSILVSADIKIGAEFSHEEEVQIRYHEYRGLPAPEASKGAASGQNLLHENCSGYYD